MQCPGVRVYPEGVGYVHNACNVPTNPHPRGLDDRRLWKHYLTALLFAVKQLPTTPQKRSKSLHMSALQTTGNCWWTRSSLCSLHQSENRYQQFLVAGNQDNVNRVFNCTVHNLIVPPFRDSQYTRHFQDFFSVLNYFVNRKTLSILANNTQFI